MEWRKEADGIRLYTGDGQIRLQVVADNIIRCVYTLREKFSDAPSLMVLPRVVLDTPWTASEDSDHILLTTGRIRLDIDQITAAFAWHNSDGDLLVREPVGGGKRLEEIKVERHIFDESAITHEEQTVDGVKTRTEGGRIVFDRMAYTTRLDLAFAEDEAIYGLGQHEEGILNYRGHSQYLYQQNMKVAMPAIVSTRGYGILWDTNGLATFHDDRHGTYFWTETDDEMDFYFVAGPELDDVVAGMRRLTGKPTMFPRWAYGYLQSKERYKTLDEMIDVVAEYRRRSIPLDCIVLDWMSWSGDLWGQKTFDPERFPDPSASIAELHSLGVKLMVSIWPLFRNDGANQVEMRAYGFLLGNDSTYNAFDPFARELYWKQTDEGLFRHGVDAWWCDCSEPFECDWKGAIKPEPWKRVLINTEEAKKYLDPEYINAYSLLHSQGIYEGQRRATSEKRVVNLTRSGFPGQQRYGAITWSGDTAANWQTLRRQIADGLNFCVTGNPRWTFDIGAFFVKRKPEMWFWAGEYADGCDDLGYRELYVRWLQLGAFLPLFRSHGTDTPREVWRFGSPGDATYDTLVKFINLRYRLLPYLYSIAASETLDDYTMFRMLAFDFRHDPNVYNIDDQFMCGSALMVCPVTHPMYYGPNSTHLEAGEYRRDVYLPAGSIWFDFWTGSSYEGGQTIKAAAPLEIMPIFVRGGSIIPMGPITQNAMQGIDNAFELRVYGDASGSFQCYEDANDGYGYEEGEFARTHIAWDHARKELKFAERHGIFPGMNANRTFNVVFVSHGRGVGLETVSDPDAQVSYNGREQAIRK